jgi:hypothetical protein
MALMDMPEIAPLFHGLSRVLPGGGRFVFSVTHPCFHSSAVQHFAETSETEDGRYTVRTGVKVSAYLAPFARKTEGILGQPEPQFFFHRPLSVLLQCGFDAGFSVDGIEEPRLPDPQTARAGLRWDDMTDVPPIMVVRMRRR